MKKRGKAEVPGNAVETAAVRGRQQAKLMTSVLWLQIYMEGRAETPIRVDGLTIKDKSGDGSDLMMIVKIASEDGYKVGFGSGTTLEELLNSTAARLRNGTLKLKEDEYRND